MANPDDDHTCQPVTDDAGTVVATVHAAPGAVDDPRFAEALAALVAAARKRMAEDDPDGLMAARQEASRARIRERNARLRGGT